MKQIFDWMRKKPLKAFEVYDGSIGVYPCEVNRLIDEAEAKWEADCCIRVVGKPFTSSCGQKWDKWTDVGEPYCSKCGKHIKISEVE